MRIIHENHGEAALAKILSDNNLLYFVKKSTKLLYSPINKICISVNTSLTLQLVRFCLKRTSKSKTNNLKTTYMNINYKSMQEASPYETPTVTTLEVLSEGVLCASGDFSIKDWEDDNDSLDF